ncbi:glycosyltransferase family 2 protein [Algoriphagus yeomjeoni]|uniref:Glycosyltransferase involved in cell wall biosynthesis n=1 Tax=Algoriphagus yeomjeoni TaxID=291403 RepID=A0A327P3Y2_9BACT|nr:glycosyltransferase family A protein [Algoriphagus yeomjeoni]RAI85592.1 glycosyltransferase involved in cell wall biosynthesis [Algoriphagus yeomjeoni]
MKPFFSVIVPVYNSEKTVARAINSVLAQTFEDWELVLIDDGSIDESFSAMKSFEAIPNVILYKQENKGVSFSRNKGVSVSSGTWLVFLDADDELTSDALINFASRILQNAEAKAILGGFKKLKDNEEVDYIPRNNKPQSTLSGSFAILRTFFNELGAYDSTLKFSENTELFHRIFISECQIEYVEEVVLIYYESLNGGSKNLKNMIDSLLIILDKHSSTLSPHVKYLYRQILGVNYLRFQNYPRARTQLLKALYIKPYKLTTLARLCISLIPPLSKKIYPMEIKS